MTDLNKKEDSRRDAEPQRTNQKSQKHEAFEISWDRRSRSDQTKQTTRSTLPSRTARYLCASASEPAPGPIGGVQNPCFLSIVCDTARKNGTQRRRAAEKKAHNLRQPRLETASAETWKIAKRSSQTSSAFGSALQRRSVPQRLCVSACHTLFLVPRSLDQHHR